MQVRVHAGAARAFPPTRWLSGVLRYNPHRLAGIAQLVEQLICNQKVVGSIPIAGTRIPPVLVRRKNFLLSRRSPFIVLFLRRGVEQSGSSSGS